MIMRGIFDAVDGEPVDTSELLQAVHLRSRRRRTWRLALLGTAVVFAVAASAALTLAPAARPPAVLTTSQAGADPSLLVGSWDLSAAGTPVGTVVGLGSVLTIRMKCGTFQGSWRANRQGGFVAGVATGPSHCPHVGPLTPAWAMDARAWRPVGAGVELLGAAGQAVARLTPSGSPRPQTTSEDLRAVLAHVGRLPADAAAVTDAELIGTWKPLPPDVGTGRASVTFDADGSWAAFDGGCDGSAGTYALAKDGAFLAVNTISPGDVACQRSDVASWPPKTTRLAKKLGELLFVDSNGHVLGRCTKQPSGRQ